MAAPGAISLFDILDLPLDPPEEAAAAARIWPWARIRSATGIVGGDEADEILLRYLQNVLEFREVTPGADGDRVGLSAEVHIDESNLGAISRRPLVLARLPGVMFWLMETQGVPARVYVTRDAIGDLELVVEGLPAEIQIPSDLLRALRDEDELATAPEDRPDVRVTGPYVHSAADSLEVTLRDSAPSSIKVRLRARFTEEWEVVLEPAVPLSFGPCVFAHVPCDAVHDFQLLPHVKLAGEEAEPPRHEQEIAIEWADSKLGGLDAIPTFAVRTLELANRDWVGTVLGRINEDREPDQQAELVIEDVAVGIPASFDDYARGLQLLPQHGRLGLRRRVHVGGAEPEAYDHSLAPIRIPLAILYELRVFRFLLQWPGAPWAFGDMAITEEGVIGGGEGTTPAVHVHVGDDALVQLGYELADFGWRLFELKKLDVHLIAFRAGVDVPALPDGLSADAFQLLLDIAFVLDEEADDGGGTGEDVPLTLKSRDGKRVEAVLRNIGWDRGGKSLDIWIPEKIRAKALDRFDLHLDEVGAVTEPDGVRYLYVTGAIPLPWGKRANETTAASATPPPGLGSGVRVHRLRIEMPPPLDAAPRWGVDGITAALRTDAFEILGELVVTDFARPDGHQVREFRGTLDLVLKQLRLGITLVKGAVTGPVDDFDYLLAAAHLGGLSWAGVTFEDIHGLFADDLVPALPPPDGNAQVMRLYDWYKADGGGRGDLTLPSSRSLTRWTPRDETTSWAAGMQVSGWGKALTADLGVFFVHASEGVSFAIGGELFALESQTPFAFAAVEHDAERDKISVLAGVDATLSTIFGRSFPGSDAIRVSGQFFWTNRPSTWAVGFIDDINTWPSLRIELPFAELFAGGCIHFVDAPGGPRAWGLLFRLRGEFDAGGLGSALFALELGARIGSWRNEAEGTGALAWLEGAIRVEVFDFFRVGLFGRVEISTLGPEPQYNRYTVELRIDTPWWLPDVTFRKVLKNGAPQPASMPIITVPVPRAAALGPGAVEAVALLVPPAGPDRSVVSMEHLRALPTAFAADDAIDQLVPVSCDAVIAIDFDAAVDDEITIGENTPDGAGTQQSGDLSARYALEGLSIRRRPRFGPDAGVWTELLAPDETQVDLESSDVTVVFQSAVSVKWNRDYVAEGRLDPKQLLVNADVPYAYITDGQNDDVWIDSEPGSPCCRDKGRGSIAPWHTLDFGDRALGVRTPALLRFPATGSTLRWGAGREPVIAPGIALPGWPRVARLALAGRAEGMLLSLTLDTRVRTLDLDLGWNATMAAATIEIEATDGLTTRKHLTFPLSAGEPVHPIRVEHEAGFDSVTVRMSGDVGVASPIVELARIRYRTIADLVAEALGRHRCLAGKERALGGGRFAWLPHHDYEITVRCRVEVAHTATGSQSASIDRRAYFRTKGLPGLNAPVESSELAPYLDEIYPRHGRLLYRREPVVCAFNERFNVLAPVDPVPDHPVAENTQPPLEWTLSVDRETASPARARSSLVAGDWIVAHRILSPPPSPWTPALSEDAVGRHVRTASTRDPLRLRYEAVLRSPAGCDIDEPIAHRSHVLVHEPVNPEVGTEPADARWAPGGRYRARLSPRGGPFTDRPAFEPADATALSFEATSGGAESWTTTDGALAPTGAAATLQWALFGEDTWRHATVRLDTSVATGQAGFAVAVNGAGPTLSGLAFLIDATGPERRLRVVRFEDGDAAELASTPLPDSGGVDSMRIEAFDDIARAAVGTSTLEVARGESRAGRFALVSSGPAVGRLRVEPIEGFAFSWTASRYLDFEHHIHTYRGPVARYELGAIGGATSTTSAMIVDTLAELREVMRPGADSEARQRLFDRWCEALGIPERARASRLEITRVESGAGTELLLLESPEPLPFSEDVSLGLWRRIIVRPELPEPGEVLATHDSPDPTDEREELPQLELEAVPPDPAEGPGRSIVEGLDARLPAPPLSPFTYVPRHTRVLTNGDETRALVIPSDVTTGAWSSLPRGRYRLELHLQRPRFDTTSPDPLAKLEQSATLWVAL